MKIVRKSENHTGYTNKKHGNISPNKLLLMLGVFSFFILFQPEAARAQCVSLTTIGSAYTQNFNTLSNTAGSTTNNLTIPGWFLTEAGMGVRDNEQYAVDTGGSTTGDIYSYGGAGSTERALGSLQSGTLIPLYGACFTNNTGTTINSVNVGYTGEEWRLGTAGRTDQLNFEYSTNAADLTTGTWTNVTPLNFVTPNTATVGALDGNAAANRTVLGPITIPLTVANGATFWIRWVDINASGADDGLAVDDFTLTPQITTAAGVSVSGRVFSGKSGISWALVTITDAAGNIRTARTNNFGFYEFESVPVGESYVFNVYAKGYEFAPQVLSINEAVENLDFQAIE
jgi:hypothetical protein